MKRCRRCGEIKTLDGFNKKSASKDGHTSQCRQCSRAQDAKWRSQNTDRRRAYREQAKVQRSQYAKAWYERNPGYRERYYEENREASYERRYRWIELNPEKHRALSAKRRALLKDSPDLDAVADYMALIRRDPCVYCGSPTEHIDHIIPLADRGAHEWQNLAPTCASCNTSKATQDVLTFMLRRASALN